MSIELIGATTIAPLSATERSTIAKARGDRKAMPGYLDRGWMLAAEAIGIRTRLSAGPVKPSKVKPSDPPATVERKKLGMSDDAPVDPPAVDPSDSVDEPAPADTAGMLQQLADALGQLVLKIQGRAKPTPPPTPTPSTDASRAVASKARLLSIVEAVGPGREQFAAQAWSAGLTPAQANDASAVWKANIGGAQQKYRGADAQALHAAAFRHEREKASRLEQHERRHGKVVKSALDLTKIGDAQKAWDQNAQGLQSRFSNPKHWLAYFKHEQAAKASAKAR